MIQGIVREPDQRWAKSHVTRTGCAFHYLAGPLTESDSPNDLLSVVSDFAADNHARVVQRIAFGLGQIPRQDGDGSALTILGNGGFPAQAAGVHACAITGGRVERFVTGGVHGTLLTDDVARYCWLTNVAPLRTSATCRRQACEVFERVQLALESAGMTCRQIVRTWFYLHDILGWYGDFNKVRSRFFREHGVDKSTIPASTGVGVTLPGHKALCADVFAFQPLDDRSRVVAVASPLQDSATNYGSSFSRAVEVQLPDWRHLFISGTASIDRKGNTVHPHDTKRQVELTMDVVQAILKARGRDWADVTRAVAYFPNIGNRHLFDEYCRTRSLRLPAVVTQCVICRDDLHFELEAEAAWRA